VRISCAGGRPAASARPLRCFRLADPVGVRRVGAR